MKKCILVFALLAFMVPALAQHPQGKWGIEVGAWYAQPRNMDSAYAMDITQSGMNSYSTRPALIGFERRWSPMVKVSYSTASWKVWLDYFHYQKETATETAADFGVFPTYGTMYYAPIADLATANNRLQCTNFNLNIGRIFHPAKTWKMVVYSGIKHIDLTYSLDTSYYEPAMIRMESISGGFLPAADPAYMDVVSMQTRTNGWGLNFGLNNIYTANSWLDFVGGVELSMVSTSQDARRVESGFFPDGSLNMMVDSASSMNLTTPSYRVFLEGKFHFGSAWYGKLGYQYQMLKDAFKNSAQPSTNVPYYYAGAGLGSTPRTTDLAVDGFYVKVGFSW
jgi:hypothetical protein